jgi:hypothetical protein
VAHGDANSVNSASRFISSCHMYSSFSPTYMKAHSFEIAWRFAAVGCHMYPAKAVTDRKYCGLAAATWNAAMPPLGGPAMWNLPAAERDDSRIGPSRIVAARENAGFTPGRGRNFWKRPALRLVYVSTVAGLAPITAG